MIVNADSPGHYLSVPCVFPVSDGHTAAVFASFEKKPEIEEIKKIWAEFKSPIHDLGLPSAPKQFIHYFEEPDRPQAKLDRDMDGGMGVEVGRLREDKLFDIKFVCLFAQYPCWVLRAVQC